MSNNIYKIVIIGDAQTGKSTYIGRLLTGEYEKRYVPTLGVEVHPLQFNTNYGKIFFNVWDIAGEEKFGGMKQGYYTESDAALSFYTIGSSDKYEQLYRASRNTPIVRVQSKFESVKVDYCDHFINSRSCLDLELPMLDLARKLTNHHDLEFIDSDPITPPTVHL